MSAVKVIDASALAALLFGEPEGPAVAQRLRGAASLVAPPLLGFELANVCLTKAKRRPEQRDLLLGAFALRDRLAIQEVAVPHDEVVRLALDTGLTAYDASYLWIAVALEADLVTLDAKLAAALAAR